jgi:hypothetical protein
VGSKIQIQKTPSERMVFLCFTKYLGVIVWQNMSSFNAVGSVFDLGTTLETSIMSEEKRMPVPCRCGLMPEENTNRRGYAYSLSCKCGGEKINFASWGHSWESLLDNWESLIQKKPYKHFVENVKSPEEVHAFFPRASFRDPYEHDRDPLRRWVRRTGGHCSGGAGPC